MSRDLRFKLRSIIESEQYVSQTARSRNRGGCLSVCLVYPNRYYTAMSSLGFQSAFALFAAQPDLVCERAFLPDTEDLQEYRRTGQTLMSLESQRPLSDFDVIAFSTSFEPDYLNIPIILSLARIPIYAAERTISHPLLLAGGAAFFINPEPVALFLDAICIGDGEDVIPEIARILTSPGSDGRTGLFHNLATVRGIYVPSLHTPTYDDERFTGFDSCEGIPFPVERGCSAPGTHEPTASRILTPLTEFGDMFLIEVSRGCPRGCRFCSSGFIYGPFRQQPCEALLRLIDHGLTIRNKIGLVGAAVSDYQGIGAICQHIVAKGAKVSVSSLRVDRLDTDMLEALVASGHKTISLAPEGGSQRLRDLVRKNLTEQQILHACEQIISRDILNLRLYFIIGLPTETEEDLEEMIRLVTLIRERVIERARSNKRLGEITISVNPFIPKPFTPFQWCGMEPQASLERKVKLLETRFRSLSNVRLKVESIRESYLQALLSRGDRRLAPLIIEMASGANFKKAARSCGIDTDRYVLRDIGVAEPLPWRVIASADQQQLLAEYERAFPGRVLP